MIPSPAAPVVAFRGAVASGDIKALSQISGVGKKTAERIVVELKDKIGAAGAWEASSAQRALSPESVKKRAKRTVQDFGEKSISGV